jgi:hypothetical protein
MFRLDPKEASLPDFPIWSVVAANEEAAASKASVNGD